MREILQMRSHGARTPEELETLLEDALMTEDHESLARLLLEHAVVCTRGGSYLHSQEEMMVNWQGNHPYIAHPQHVVQARDIALIVSGDAINVACRRDGTWRYAIILQSVHKERNSP